MKQIEFENRNNAFWTEFEQNLNDIKNPSKHQSLDKSQFPKQYRKLCQHLAIAKSRQYTLSLINRLNILVQKGYECLYGSNIVQRNILWQFLFHDFPATIQAQINYIYVACAVFFIPMILMAIACYFNAELIYSIINPNDVREIEYMYNPDLEKLGRERQSTTDLMMFGFYIKNNIGISFYSFASGLFFGIGSLFVLAFNSLYIGSIAGHLSSIGFAKPFFSFVSGHSAFELMAIVLSGAAGLRIGFSLIAPGSLSRIKALQIASIDAIKIIYGSTLMLVIAAFIEAYWSSISAMPPLLKYGVGIFFWILLIYYCFYFGRQYESE